MNKAMMKNLLVTAGTIIAVMAIVERVPQLRKIVKG